MEFQTIFFYFIFLFTFFDERRKTWIPFHGNQINERRLVELGACACACVRVRECMYSYRAREREREGEN